MVPTVSLCKNGGQILFLILQESQKKTPGFAGLRKTEDENPDQRY